MLSITQIIKTTTNQPLYSSLISSLYLTLFRLYENEDYKNIKIPNKIKGFMIF